MSSAQRRKKANRVRKAALRLVQEEAASEAETVAPGVVAENTEETPVSEQPRREYGKMASQVWQNLVAQFGGVLRGLTQQAAHLATQVKVRRANKRLHVRETVSLGDKRFVAIVQVDGQEFLLGGSQNSVGMLAQLSPDSTLPAFSQALKQQCEADRNLA